MPALRTKIRITISILTVGIATLLVAAYLFNPTLKNNRAKPQNATVIKNAAPLKNFSLHSTTGATFTENSFLGHWTLMFFGYTTCPDICPATLNVTKEIWKNLNPKPFRFIFASINPKQDNILDLSNFLHNYNKDFIGLTGDKEQMDKLSSQLGIYAMQTLNENLINHTSSLMLINPQGRLTAILSPPFDTEILKKDLLILTKRGNSS